MARLREGQLLNRAALRVLILTLLATAARADGPRPPVFFEDPDKPTAELIRSGIEDLGRQQLADHTRGREALADIGYWAVPALVSLLQDGDGNEVRNAALTMGEILDPRALPALSRVAEEGNHQYAAGFAALMLGNYRDRALLPRLAALIREASKHDRRVASVLAVAKTRGPEAFEILIRTLRTEKLSIVREAATFCLGFFPEQALENSPEGKVPVRELMASLKSSETALNRAALLALALLGHRDLKPLYLKAAASTDDELRRIALLALGRFPDEDVTNLLLTTVEDPRAPGSLKVMAAFLLKDRKDPAALDRLKRAVPRVNEPKVRACLILALSNFEDPEVAQLLILALGDRKDQVRAAAAIALSRLVTPELKELAIKAFNALLAGRAGTVDSDVLVNVRLAREILMKGEGTGEFVWLGNEAFTEDLPKDVEEKLLDLVNEEAWQVLGLNDLTDLKVNVVQGQRFRVQDETSELRDLAWHLERHPYFGPADIPEPKLAITPRDPGAAVAGPREDGR